MSMLPQKMAIWAKEGKAWLRKNEKNVIFSVAFVLIAVFAFEIGVLSSKQSNDHTLVIEKPTQSIAQAKENIVALQQVQGTVAGAENAQPETNTGQPKKESETQNTQQCAYVGSKNSKKYHSPSCSYAKRIKPENTVCFKSKEEAEGRGYTAGCIK